MINTNNPLGHNQGIQGRSPSGRSSQAEQAGPSVTDLYEKLQSGDMTLKEFKEAMASGKYNVPLQDAAGALADAVTPKPEQPKSTR